MTYSRFLALGLMVLGVLGMGVQCSDPGNPKTGGRVQHFAFRLFDGSVLGPTNYGLWYPGNAPIDPPRDQATDACHWTVTMHGKIVASGGRHDAVMSIPGLRGGVLHASSCGYFYK